MVGGDNYRKSQFNLAVAGRAAAGLARSSRSCSPRRSRSGIAPATHVRSRSRCSIFLGDRYWARRNYEDAYLGTSTSSGDDPLRQHRSTRSSRSSSAREAVAQTARTLGITQPPEPVLRDRPRRARPSTRSRWRAPSPRSTTAATASTAAIFGNRAARDGRRVAAPTDKSPSSTTARSAPVLIPNATAMTIN